MAGIEQGVGFPIRAIDQFSPAFDKLTEKLTGAQSAFSKFNGMLAGLGVGISVGGLAAIVSGATDALDKLGDLSKTTRIAVDDLAGLRFAAQLSGSSLEGTAGAINKLATNMGKNAEKFAALGVSARDPIEALKQLADATNGIADPQQRAAVLAEALGKSWQEVAPLLAEGSARIGEMIGKGREMAGVTQALVDQADAFNDKMVELSGNGGKINAVLAQLLPLLNATADGLLEGGKAATLWEGAGMVLTEILRVLVVLGGNVAFVFRAMGIELGGIAAQITALANGDFKRFAEIGRQMKDDAAANRRAFDAWEKSIVDVGAVAKTTTRELAAMDQVQRRLAQESGARARDFLESEKRRREAAEEERKALAEKERLRALDIKGWVEYIEAKEKEDIAALEAEARRHEARFKDEERLRHLDEKGWIAYIEAKEREDIEALERVAAAHKSQAEIRQEREIVMWESISDAAGAFFSDLVMNGKSAFDNLKRWVKQLLADMVGLFAKRWVLNMAAGGSVWGSAAQAAAGGAGSDSMAGSLLNTAGSAIMGGGSIAGAAGMFYGGMSGAIPAAAIGAEAVAAGVGTTSTAAALGSSLSGVYSALAAIPVWGWIAMAVIAIGAWIAGSKAGGPKVGGSFFSGGAVPGTDNGRFFTPSQGDEQMRTFVEATSQGYQDAIARLGGTAGVFNFGAGFDHDPNGSARSRVSSIVTDANGRQIYGMRDREMDDKEVEGALGLEAQRMLLAALQASDWSTSPGVGGILNTVDVATATSEMIAAVLGLADTFVQTINMLDSIDLGAVIEDLSKGPLERFNDFGRGLQDLAAKTKISVEGLGQLANAAGEYRSAVMQMVAAMEQAKTEIDAMFGETSRNIQMSTMNPEERYAFLQDESNQLLQNILGSTDASQIQAWSARINQNINDAFGLLSPEQQRAMQSQFLERIDTTNQAIQQQLSQAQSDTVTEANRVLGEIEKILTANAGKLERAADTQLEAANIQRNTPIQVDVDVEVFDGRVDASVVNGG